MHCYQSVISKNSYLPLWAVKPGDDSLSLIEHQKLYPHANFRKNWGIRVWDIAILKVRGHPSTGQKQMLDTDRISIQVDLWTLVRSLLFRYFHLKLRVPGGQSDLFIKYWYWKHDFDRGFSGLRSISHVFPQRKEFCAREQIKLRVEWRVSNINPLENNGRPGASSVISILISKRLISYSRFPSGHVKTCPRPN